MRKSRRLAFIPLVLLVLAVLACDDGVIYEAHPVESRGITCITVDGEGRLIAPIEVGGFTENAGNYDLLISEDGGLTWDIEYHRDRESPTQTPYGVSYLSEPIHEPGEMPACEASRSAVNPTDEHHRVWYEQGLRIIESKDGWESRLIHHLPELRQEIRYYFFHEYGTLYSDIRVLAIGPHDVDFDPKTGNIVFAMGWDGVLVYTPESKWYWRGVEKYQRDYEAVFPRASEVLSSEYFLAAALGFLVLTSLVSYLVRRSMYQISMLVIGWAGWLVMLIGGTPTTVRGIMPGQGHADVYFLLGAPLFLLVALPMILACFYDLIRYLWRRTPYIVLMSVLTAAAYLIPYYLWVDGTIFRYETAKWVAFLIAVGLVTMFARRVRSTSQRWAQRITLPPKGKRGKHPIEYVPLGSVLERVE